MPLPFGCSRLHVSRGNHLLHLASMLMGNNRMTRVVLALRNHFGTELSLLSNRW
jgi:hypothetical protein